MPIMIRARQNSFSPAWRALSWQRFVIWPSVLINEVPPTLFLLSSKRRSSHYSKGVVYTPDLQSWYSFNPVVNQYGCVLSKALCHTNAFKLTRTIFTLDRMLSKPRNVISSRQALRSIADSRVFGFCFVTYLLLNHCLVFVTPES